MKFKEILRNIAKIVNSELNCSYRLFLFGSRVAGIHDEKSDIDIGIVSDIPVTSRQMLTIQEKLEQIPTLLKIDFVDFNSAGDEFKKTALKYIQEIKQ